MSFKRDIRFRVYLSFTGMVLLAMAIIVKAATIQVSEGDTLRAKAEKAHTRNEKLLPERGNIYAEDGTLLSSTIPQFDLRIDFKAINKDTFGTHVDSLAVCLANLFKDASASAYERRLRQAFHKGERYHLLKKNAAYYQYQAARNFPIFNKGKNRGGFIAEAKPKRVNPYGMLAYRTIGLWRENATNIGLEQKYDSILCGKAGSRIIRKTTGNVWMPIEGSEVDPVNGQDIVTTIDVNIQDVTEHALLDVLTKYNCAYGTAIVMEVKTGKIRALANLGRQADGSYWEDFNYALIPSEPGSTFKLMSLYALLEDGYVTINDKVNAQGGVAVFGNQRVVDDHGGDREMTIRKAFARSSNVAFAKLVNQYYHKDPMKYIRHLQDLKLHERTGIDLDGERKPKIKTTKSSDWNKVTSLPWIGYGYESLITPLHTCMVYNAVANNGKLMKPYLVSAIKEYGLPVKTFEPTVLVERIGKPETVRQMKEAMLAVVEEGTGRGIKSPFYGIGGKTGTAQVADKGISYKDGVRQGSFAGFFPYNNPEYTIVVMVRSTPHGTYYGAVVGAPVFKTIADKLYAAHIGGWAIPADSISKQKEIVAKNAMADNMDLVVKTLKLPLSLPSWNGVMALHKGDRGYQLEKKETGKNQIPDVSGMGLRDALYMLESNGIKVHVSGQGKVVSQSLPPGTKLTSGQVIQIQLG